MSPRQLARLRNHALLRAHQRRGGGRSHLVRTYFDTPTRSLHAHEMALGLDQADGEPDLSHLRDGALRDLIGREGLGKSLAPVFTTDIERSRLPLRVGDSVIDLAFDVGRIRAADRQEPICEAQLQLVAGRPEQLYELALELHKTVPFRLEHRDEIARGYGLASEDPPQPARAPEVTLNPHMTVGGGFAALARAGLAHLIANEEAVFIGENPEGIHQMRVAVRRLRALIGAFKGAIETEAADFLRLELGWLQRQLGPARDWDVFLNDTVAMLTGRLPDDQSLAALHRAAEGTRRQAYFVAHRALQDHRYTRLLLRFQLWLDSDYWDGGRGAAADSLLLQPIAPFAAQVLGRRHKRLIKLGRRDDLAEHELHDLRIRAKKLRYAVEFFQFLYRERSTKRHLRALAGLQDTLGSLHDAMVGQQLLAALKDMPGAAANGDGAAATRAESRREAHLLEHASGIVAGFQAARIADDLRRFRETWPCYADLDPFWTGRAED